MFPFGHKAVLIQISERKFEKTKKNGIVALLRYREFIVVREPIKEYPGPGQEPLTFSDGRNFPYKSLQITNLVTPKLDPKELTSVFASKDAPGQPKCPEKDPESGTAIAYWPQVSKEDYQWHLIGTDWIPDLSGHVVMLEDVSEYLYRIDRSMFTIMSGKQIQSAAGIMVGRVIDVPENDRPFGQTEEEIIDTEEDMEEEKEHMVAEQKKSELAAKNETE